MSISLKSLGGNLPFIDLGMVKVSISLKSLGGGSLSLIDLGRAFTDD